MIKIHFKKISKILIAAAFLLFIYAFIEPYWIQVKINEIVDKDIPSSFKGIKIVFVSDIHHTKVYPRHRVKKLVKKINSMEPDIILLGGDYVNKSPDYIQPCFEELSRLRAPMGVYGVLGNHDHWEGAELSQVWMKKAGIKNLDNKSVWISKSNQKIKIGGVGDYWEDDQLMENTTGDVSENDFTILLSHNPDFVESIKNKEVDLVLSGHTHGGQVTLFGLWAPFVPSKYKQKYRTGLVRTDYTNVIITNGIGNAGYYPVRFFARPQINVIVLT